jgi:hypothetical protein
VEQGDNEEEDDAEEQEGRQDEINDKYDLRQRKERESECRQLKRNYHHKRYIENTEAIKEISKLYRQSLDDKRNAKNKVRDHKRSQAYRREHNDKTNEGRHQERMEMAQDEEWLRQEKQTN